MTTTRIAVACAAMIASTGAIADSTLTYRSEGGCTGDFERVELKALFLRVDSRAQDSAGSMIYDHGEKLAYFIDDRTHTFMQTEMDEDAVDLQTDIMKSLRTKMRRESGVDPFEMMKSVCPEFNANSRDRQPGEGVDCGNGMKLGGAMTGADGKPMSQQDMAAAMQHGGMAGDPGMQQMMQKMMEQQLAQMSPDQRAQVQQMMANGGGAMPGLAAQGARAPAPAPPPRVDRDAGEAEVGGIGCTRREHLRGDEMLREDCYATPATLKLGEAETRRIARFSKTIEAWSRSFAPEAAAAQDERVLVRRVCYAAGHENGRATLTIDRSPIADARFEVPAGYKPMDLGMDAARGRQSD